MAVPIAGAGAGGQAWDVFRCPGLAMGTSRTRLRLCSKGLFGKGSRCESPPLQTGRAWEVRSGFPTEAAPTCSRQSRRKVVARGRRRRDLGGEHSTVYS